MLASYETSLPSELRRRAIYEWEAVIIVKKVHQQLEQLIIRSPNHHHNRQAPSVGEKTSMTSLLQQRPPSSPRSGAGSSFSLTCQALDHRHPLNRFRQMLLSGGASPRH